MDSDPDSTSSGKETPANLIDNSDEKENISPSEAEEVNLSDDQEEEESTDNAIPAPPWPPTQFYSPAVMKAQKKSLASLQRSLVLCHEMDSFAKHTVTKLAEGVNQFQLLEDQQATMEKDLLETADNFEDMTVCCGVVCPWRKKQHGPIDEVVEAPPPIPVQAAHPPSHNQPGQETDPESGSLVIIPHDHVELQMEYEMELVEGYIDHLEGMSSDIHTKLTAEVQIVDSVTDQMDRNIIRVVLARNVAKTMLKST